MAKAYWITCYRSISAPGALAADARLAGPAIQAAGGRFLVRGNPARTYEHGLSQRTVVTAWESVAKGGAARDRPAPSRGPAAAEWERVAKAVAAHDSPGYQEALKALGKGAERDVRIVEAAGQVRRASRAAVGRARRP